MGYKSLTDRKLPVDSPEEHTSALIALRQVLDRLDERNRALILLRYFGEKTRSPNGSA